MWLGKDPDQVAKRREAERAAKVRTLSPRRRE